MLASQNERPQHTHCLYAFAQGCSYAISYSILQPASCQAEGYSPLQGRVLRTMNMNHLHEISAVFVKIQVPGIHLPHLLNLKSPEGLGMYSLAS